MRIKQWHGRFLLLLMSVGLVGSLVACGPTLDNPGVDKTKQVKDLTQDEKDTIKVAVDAEFNTEYMKSLCKFNGLLAGSIIQAFGQDGKATCQKQIDTCDATPKVGATISKADLADCNATVEEVMACLKGQKAAIDKLNETIAPYSCEKLPTKDDKSFDTKVFQIAACETLAQKCPQQFGSSNSTD